MVNIPFKNHPFGAGFQPQYPHFWPGWGVNPQVVGWHGKDQAVPARGAQGAHGERNEKGPEVKEMAALALYFNGD